MPLTATATEEPRRPHTGSFAYDPERASRAGSIWGRRSRLEALHRRIAIAAPFTAEERAVLDRLISADDTEAR